MTKCETPIECGGQMVSDIMQVANQQGSMRY